MQLRIHAWDTRFGHQSPHMYYLTRSIPIVYLVWHKAYKVGIALRKQIERRSRKQKKQGVLA